MATTKNKTTTKRKPTGKTKTGEKRIRRVGAGRPQIMTESTIQKLEEGFAKGLNVMECCLFADISKSTYYNFTTEHPEYLERFETLKSNVKMIAKMNLYDKIKVGDDYNSRWYLERTSDEFNPKNKQELTGKDGNPIEIQSTVQIYLPDNQREDKTKE